MAYEVVYKVKDLGYSSKPFMVYKIINYDSGGVKHEHVEAFRTRKLADDLAERLNIKSDD